MPDRNERALLMAELQGRGVEVAAEERAPIAWHRIVVEGLKPAAVLWDCKLGAPDEAMLELARKVVPGVRFLFLGSVGCKAPAEMLSEGDVSESRPISVGKLAEELVLLAGKRDQTDEVAL